MMRILVIEQVFWDPRIRIAPGRIPIALREVCPMAINDPCGIRIIDAVLVGRYSYDRAECFVQLKVRLLILPLKVLAKQLDTRYPRTEWSWDIA